MLGPRKTVGAGTTWERGKPTKGYLNYSFCLANTFNADVGLNANTGGLIYTERLFSLERKITRVQSHSVGPDSG